MYGNMDKYLFKCLHLSMIKLLTATVIDNVNSNEISMQNQSMEETSSKNTQVTDCSSIFDCLRCNINGCLKCAKFIMKDTRQCVEKCPTSYISQWSSNSELMGRICHQSSFYNSMQTLIAGGICGAFLCFLFVFIGVLMFKRKQHKMNKKSIKDQLIDDEYDRHEFVRQLDELRPYAEYFLHILNDTRKQIRKSYVSGDKTVAAKYHPIVRDLAKILILLNRPVELIDGPPHDWSRLLQWADRILAQYKPQQQLTQLIEFLQSSASQSSQDDSRLTSQHTTFKSLFYSTPVVQNRKKIMSSTLPPTINLNSSLAAEENDESIDKINSINQFKSFNSDDVRGSLISLQEFINESKPRSANQPDESSNCYGDSFEHVKNYLSKGSLLLIEDELIEFKLRHRPQDEIITEL